MNSFPGTDLLLAAIFSVFLCATVAGGMIAVLTTRIIRSVCGLALCSVGLAGLYYFLNSPFLALMEILIYIGAVCVTIIFAVMLAEPDEHVPEGGRFGSWPWAAGAVVISASVFWGLVRLATGGAWAAPEARLNDGSLEAVGKALLTTYSMAFELISLVLLVAILGALVIARAGRSKR
jgi:NADH-quinone oxidoreductase subunit J